VEERKEKASLGKQDALARAQKKNIAVKGWPKDMLAEKGTVMKEKTGWPCPDN